MKIRLNYWQLLILFSPFFAALGGMFIPPAVRISYHVTGISMTIALCIDVFIAVWYQVYLLTAFNKKIKGTIWITINNIIAILATIVFLSTFVYMAVQQFGGTGDSGPHPVHSKSASLGAAIVGLLMLHLFITFFLINNLYVSFRIQKIKDPLMLQSISSDFGEPMKRLLITSLFVITGSFVIAIVIIIIKTRFWGYEV